MIDRELDMRGNHSSAGMAAKSPGETSVVVFLHIFKGAGTTFIDVLRRQYGNQHVLGFDRYYRPLEELTHEASPGQLRSCHSIVGHMCFGIHEFIERPCRYVTFLRDPIDRTISAYHFMKENPYHPCYADILRGRSLESMIDEGEYYLADNLQVRVVCGLHSPDRVVPVTAADLELAKQRLCDEFTLAGTLDTFDESLVFAARAFGWTRPVVYDRKRKTQSRPRLAETAAATREKIADANRYDLELVEFARNLMQERISRAGPGFDRQLGDLRRRNHRARSWQMWVNEPLTRLRRYRSPNRSSERASRLLRSVLDTAPVNQEPGGEVDVQIRIGNDNWLRALWVLKSFYCAFGQPCHFTIHDDGTLDRKELASIWGHFPWANVVNGPVGTRTLTSYLKTFPRCRSLHQRSLIVDRVLRADATAAASQWLILDTEAIFLPATSVESMHGCGNATLPTPPYVVDGGSVDLGQVEECLSETPVDASIDRLEENFFRTIRWHAFIGADDSSRADQAQGVSVARCPDDSMLERAIAAGLLPIELIGGAVSAKSAAPKALR